MTQKSFTSYFVFSSQQQKVLFIFLLIIAILQLIYFFVDFNTFSRKDSQNKNWLSLQSEINAAKEKNKKTNPKIYPFNPNFITDYKGYTLGMTVEEIDRLLAFRKQNKYVNSAKEFQQITQISDTLLHTIAPYFKFPDWIKKKKETQPFEPLNKSNLTKKEKITLIDLNKATQEDLIKVYGIGEILSQRILKQKENLGSFVSMEQLTEIWGISPETIENLNKHFKILTPPTIKKININNASINELTKFPYFKYALAKQIITYRSMNGNIKDTEDLIKIKNFPIEKAKIISLYLTF